MTMPGMTGVALASEARKRCPDLAVLVATGNGAAVDAAEAAAAGVVRVLEKPMTRDVVARAVREALDETRRVGERGPVAAE